MKLQAARGLLLALLLPLRVLSAQESTTVIEFVPFTVDGMSAEEGMVIEDLVRDHIKKIKNVLLVFPGIDDIIPRSDIAYTFQGKIYNEADSYILQLDVLDLRTQKQNTWTSSYRSSSDMALKAPTINYLALLGNAVKLEDSQPPEVIRAEALWGRWRGDSGIEQVFLFPNGQGRAYFSRGASMELSYRIEGKKIIVEQKSQNDPRYYAENPAPVAAVLAESAEPKRWELSLYNGSQLLRGLLFETTAEYDGIEVSHLRNGSVRPAEWVKNTR